MSEQESKNRICSPLRIESQVNLLRVMQLHLRYVRRSTTGD